MSCWKVTYLLILCVFASTTSFAQNAQNSFTKNDFYQAMAGEDAAAIDRQLDLLKTASVKDKTAFEGALLMKKASLAAGPKKKLDLFKKGHKKLEAVIEKDSVNAEYRFLRLMIQEHAPKILGYRKEMEADKNFIKNNYKKLPPVVQEAVANYSKASGVLKPADL